MATDPTDPTPAMSDPQTPKPRPPPSPVTTTYLFLYNFISTILWFSVLGRVLLLLPLAGHKRVYGGVGAFTRNTQTLAALEIFHSLFGVVRAPLATTVMQLSSRLLLVWGVVWMFERETAWRWAYCSMLVAWSVTEVIRYCYFACQVGGGVPGWLKWLRYNTFFILYPIGISSETWLIYCSLGAAGEKEPALEWVFRLILLFYIPGSYILYTHMMAQRRKEARKGKAE